MMHRAQILVEEWQYQALKSIAERDKRSLSEVLREILTKHLGEDRAKYPGSLSTIEGIGADPKVSGRNHDAWLYKSRSRR